MTEKDPYAEKRKNSNDETRMDDEMMEDKDANPDTTSNSSHKPEDDISPSKPKTKMPDQQ